ncbi:MAG: DEAD/DEAH box helicase [Anaerolineales bacterium]
MSLDLLLEQWQNNNAIRNDIVYWDKIPARQGWYSPFPDEVEPTLRAALSQIGIHQLYHHQQEAFRYIQENQNLLITSGTASGKSLCYNLPILNHLLHDPLTCALYLFPTKALAHDQAHKLNDLLQGIPEFHYNQKPHHTPIIGIYDGDTPQPQRQAIRQNSRLVFTNPDMLHFGILPNHPQWERFFSRLYFVVIDEIHSYRGVFGSHIANVIRRLKRIVNYYGAKPIFILTSGTISNPLDFATKLIEEPLINLAEDSSPQGEKNLLFYNPPIINTEFGLRAHPFRVAKDIIGDLLHHHSQTIVFGTSHRAVERLLIEVRQSNNLEPGINPEQMIQGYRSSYLPQKRRQIEQDLKNGKIRVVITTNALELGIDIGELETALLVGFPGSIASTWQQLSRAGRKNQTSLGIILLTADPLDQYLARNPHYFQQSSPEQPLIDPDNPLILLNHLRCALAEIPFEENEPYGNAKPDLVKALLDALLYQKEAMYNKNRYFYIAHTSPQTFSLRTNSFANLQLITENQGSEELLGLLDRESADRLVHPGAIYLHEGDTYRVMDLDFENNIAKLAPTTVEYLTNPHEESTINEFTPQKSTQIQNSLGGNFRLGFGDVTVTTQVTGYSKVDWTTHQIIERVPLSLPPRSLSTKAFWLTLEKNMVEALREQGAWTAQPNKYGVGWARQKALARARDHYRCQICGVEETDRSHDVHHKIPFRHFNSAEEANRLDNLITLCRNCHQKVETNLRIQSGLAGLGYALRHIAPLFAMCDRNDLGVHIDANFKWVDRLPTILIYENIAGGIGLCWRIFGIALELIHSIYHHVQQCPCKEGCPSCTGAVSENGIGGKEETLIILSKMTGNE